MSSRMRRLFAAFAVSALLLTGAAACTEDCDEEDRRNREAECGFSDHKPRLPSKPATKPIPAKTKR